MKKEKKKASPKVCPHCGAKLLRGAVFCGACGLSVIAEEKTTEEPMQSDKKPAPTEELNSKPAEDLTPTVATDEATQSDPKPKPKRKKKMDNYDGYYDDVKPVDAGEFETGKMDREQIKRVAIIIGATLGVIGVAAVMLVVL